MSEQAMDEYQVWSDRRQRRSQERSEALRLQLDYVRQRLALSAIVLCDDHVEGAACGDGVPRFKCSKQGRMFDVFRFSGRRQGRTFDVSRC